MISHSARGLPSCHLSLVICLLALILFCPAAGRVCAGDSFQLSPAKSITRVVIVEDTNAISDYQPDAARVGDMIARGVTRLTGQAAAANAWRSLVSTQDVVGIKIFSGAGEISGTRPAVVSAVVHGLLGAGLPANHIILWDKHAKDLRAAGFFGLGRQLGVRVAGAVESGYDPTNFYLPDSPVIGNLLYGDLEFGRKGEAVGRKSFVTKIVSRDITKIISIAPLLNDNELGVSGHLYSVALGSVDNTARFEGDAGRLPLAVPEIYALPSVGDRVVLNITDALIGQYEGGASGLLHYSTVPGQLWFSRDPVALDTMAVAELARERRALGAPEFKPDLEIYTNAVLLQLGASDPEKIQVENVR